MIEKVKFFCKLNQDGDVIIHSICRSTKSIKYCFASGDRSLNKHPESIRQKVLGSGVKSKRHVDISLKDEEQYIYINPRNGLFWFKGKNLDTKAAANVTNQPSFDVEEANGNVAEGNRLQVDQVGSLPPIEQIENRLLADQVDKLLLLDQIGSLLPNQLDELICSVKMQLKNLHCKH